MVRLKRNRSSWLIHSSLWLLNRVFSLSLDCYFYQHLTPTSGGVFLILLVWPSTTAIEKFQLRWGEKRAFSYARPKLRANYSFSFARFLLTHEHRLKLKSIVEVEIDVKIKVREMPALLIRERCRIKRQI